MATEQDTLALWPRQHDLPPRWDGHTVEWGEWLDLATVFVCPPPKHALCAACDGPITHYPRRPGDIPPKTTAVNDEQRWAHDRLADWVKRPHRAVPADV